MVMTRVSTYVWQNKSRGQHKSLSVKVSWFLVSIELNIRPAFFK